MSLTREAKYHNNAGDDITNQAAKTVGVEDPYCVAIVVANNFI